MSIGATQTHRRGAEDVVVVPSRARKALFWGLLLAGLVALTWLAAATARSTVGYLYVKQQSHGWIGRLVAFDTRLGTRSVPDSQGAEILGGVATPVRFNGDGFRVPLDHASTRKPPVILAVGDSFTFGSGVAADQAFPWRVADALGGSVLNAGAPGYGLAEMLLIAKELVHRHRPDLVLVQASTWLPQRARRRFRSGRFAVIPVPYFIEGPDAQHLVLSPPMFRPKVFDLPVADYRGTRKGLLDWASFTLQVGLPLYAHDDPDMARYYVHRVLSGQPRVASAASIAAYVYPEILKVCRSTGTRMVVVVLEAAGKRNDPQKAFDLPPEVPVIDTKPGLYAPLRSWTEEAYLRAYGHWHGDPPVFTDEHPNAKAHGIIADQVLAALRRS